MFGTNAVRKYDGAGSRLQVQDIWYTLQGEGPFSGRPAIFIRLTGCNLRCWFCDTKWDDEKDPYIAVDEMAEQLIALSIQHKCKLFVFTGGEPLRQNLSKLLWRVAVDVTDAVFQIETAGTLWQAVLKRSDVVIVVCPKTEKINPEIFARADAFKYVLKDGFCNGTDGLPVFNTQKKNGDGSMQLKQLARPRPGAPVYVMPCDEYDEEKNKANNRVVGRIACKHGYIGQVQAHKYLELK